MRTGHFALALSLSLIAWSAAQAGEDRVEDYGVSATSPCPSVDHPPSAAEATRLITCSGSYDNFGHAAVYRVFGVRVQVGSPRAYTYGDPGGNEIDPKAEVYPIRGTKSLAICSPISEYMQNSGKNCSVYDSSGDGICYRTPFGDWKCVLNGEQAASRHNVPPPG